MEPLKTLEQLAAHRRDKRDPVHPLEGCMEPFYSTVLVSSTTSGAGMHRLSV